jgi:hypothetical protein
MRVEVEKDDVKFEYDGKKYSVTGTAIHETHTEDVGIGSYEFWGSRGYDSQIVQQSDYEECEFECLSIYPEEGAEEIPNPSKELVEAAQEALYSATYERAEERAAEMAD